jgi:hypothetical protein
MSVERDLNEYLFLEFGFDVEEDESRVSESWPFDLRKVAELPDGPIFEFDDDEPFFALVGGGLNFVPKAGMDLADLQLQLTGGRWIGERDPIGLDLSMPDDPSVPSSLERRRALEAIGEKAALQRPVEILEGLFLRAPRRYVGLFRGGDKTGAIVGGLSHRIVVPFPEASGWRRLAWGVGRWLQGEVPVAGTSQTRR